MNYRAVYRIAIIEDEAIHRDCLTAYLNRFGKERELAFRLAFFGDAVSFLDSYRKEYDLLFLDIRMPGIDGMDAARRLREIDPDVGLIFVTSLQQYAVDGYSVGACDYIVKPFTYETFAIKLDHALYLLPGKDRLIAFRFGTAQYRISEADIRWLESRGHNVAYHLKTGEVIRRISLNDAEKELGDRFLRLNSGMLVNMDHVRSTENDSVLLGDQALPIAQMRKAAVLQRLYDYRGWTS